MKGTIVVLKNLATEEVYRSGPSSENGFFRIDSLEKGLYAFGALREEGYFGGREIIGIDSESEARLSLALRVEDEKPAGRSTNEPPAVRDEKFLGRIITFDAEKNTARIFVEQGEALLGDTVHFIGNKEKGSETDFYQTIRYMEQNGQPTSKAVAGQYYDIRLEKAVGIEDWVYLKEKKGLGVFLLTPIGMATVLASSTAIVYTVVNPPTEVSVFRY